MRASSDDKGDTCSSGQSLIERDWYLFNRVVQVVMSLSGFTYSSRQFLIKGDRYLFGGVMWIVAGLSGFNGNV
jgi:hypothetical protein